MPAEARSILPAFVSLSWSTCSSTYKRAQMSRTLLPRVGHARAVQGVQSMGG
ncbi:hypothetical protein PF002_g12408 [Phytophthora fragariae]|uniref:Uncharacterized protein n=1 Tax=Phytophthora fragariae TaxID=53985 RepID=A0A6A3Z8W0_9STRA|nr:hypothetical protein PF003_g26207 [Phytophthora fragariae]KAE9232357.1 hypothetical protein PF002_g12408 [Phytophthora fragariae]